MILSTTLSSGASSLNIMLFAEGLLWFGGIG